jgi:hypothetical protein
MTENSGTGPTGGGERIAADDIARAVTAAELVYEDGSTQVFRADGSTTYVEHGRPTAGEWYVDDEGRFCSFWPPSYRACYDLRWIVEAGEFVGITFRDIDHGSESVGRYR